MKRRSLQWNVLGDDGGQALTEFAIVIPIVLLMFFAILQYFYVVRASQLGSYAAYAAARSYAVRHDEKDAQFAAAMALAPIGRPMPGEPLYVNLPVNIPGSGALSALLNQDGQYAVNYFEGLAYVSQVRFRPGLLSLGGSVNFTTGGDPTQVNVAISYPQPVFVPGLAELWNLVTGERIYHQLEPLSEGLNGLPGKLEPVFSKIDQAQEIAEKFGRPARNLPFPIYPYINVRSKCSMGFEDWSGKLRLIAEDKSAYGFPNLSDAANASGGLDSKIGSISGVFSSLF